MEADAGDPRLLHQPARQERAALVARPLARAKLYGDRQTASDGSGARDRDGAVRVVEQRGAGARLADLADGTAHVQVDQVGPRRGHDLGRVLHHVRVVAEELHRHRVLVGVDAEELRPRALVAVVEAEARHHLGHRERGAMPPRLKANEPGADAGQRRQHQPVGEAQTAQGPGGAQGAHDQTSARWHSAPR